MTRTPLTIHRAAAVMLAAAVVTGALCSDARAEGVEPTGDAAATLPTGALGGLADRTSDVRSAVEERVVAQLRRVTKPIVREVIRMRPETAHWQWQVKYFRDQEVTVYARSGGEIGVHAGLFERLSPTDDELAQSVAHALGTVIGTDRRQIAVASTPQDLLPAGSMFGDGLSAIPMLLARLSPEHTVAALEDSGAADRVGLELAARAGFDPRAAVSLIEKLRQLPEAERQATGGVDDARLRSIRRVLPEMIELYRNQQRRMIADLG